MRHAKSVEEVLQAFYAYRDSGFARKDSKALFIKPNHLNTPKDALENSLHSIVQTIATRFY